jgi:hypothetical protein
MFILEKTTTYEVSQNAVNKSSVETGLGSFSIDYKPGTADFSFRRRFTEYFDV